MLGPNLPTIIDRSWEHVCLVWVSLGIALSVALPLGIYLAKTRYQRCATVIMQVAGAIQTVPSLALIAFIVILFSWISLPTIGTVPAIVALVLYALLPLLRNTYTGIRQVDPVLVEVAQVMGMEPMQVLFQVELPLALPVIMAGIRISTVWTIGIATLCGLIGAGGLGDLIIIGLRSIQVGYLLAGTLPAALMAVLFDWLLGRLEAWLLPMGLAQQQGGN